MDNEALHPLPAFRPALGLGNPHVQTIWPALLREPRALNLEREVWPRGGHEGSVDMVMLPFRRQRPGALLLHGLEGSSRSPYLRGMLAAFDRAGWNAAALEFRSCGPTAPAMPQLYHSGKTDEIAFAVAELSRRWTGQPVVACGFSLGGNALLKWLAEAGAGCGLQAAVAISVPFDLDASARCLDAPGVFAAIYRKNFLRSLKRKATRTAHLHHVPFSVEQVSSCRTLRAFDALVTAPLFGFSSAEDYYAQNSCAGFLPRIQTPTLMISSVDDPFIPVSAIPRHAIAHNPHLQLALYDRGGHAGFVSGRWGRLSYHAETLALSFVRSRLEELAAKCG